MNDAIQEKQKMNDIIHFLFLYAGIMHAES